MILRLLIVLRLMNWLFECNEAAPDLLDLSGETQITLDSYGLGRKEPENNRFAGIPVMLTQ